MFLPTRLVPRLFRRVIPAAAHSQTYEMTFGAPRHAPGSVTFLLVPIYEKCLLAKGNPYVAQAYAMYFGCGMHLLHLFPVQESADVPRAMLRRVYLSRRGQGICANIVTRGFNPYISATVCTRSTATASNFCVSVTHAAMEASYLSLSLCVCDSLRVSRKIRPPSVHPDSGFEREPFTYQATLRLGVLYAVGVFCWPVGIVLRLGFVYSCHASLAPSFACVRVHLSGQWGVFFLTPHSPPRHPPFR